MTQCAHRQAGLKMQHEDVSKCILRSSGPFEVGQQSGTNGLQVTFLHMHCAISATLLAVGRR